MNWGRSSASQFKRFLVDAENGSNTAPRVADKVANHCGVCQVLNNAPPLPTAGTSKVPASIGKVRAVLPILDDVITLRAMRLSSEFPLLVRVLSEGPLEAWDAFAGSRIVVSGKPRGR